jgi:hypothetical protein
MIVATTPSNAAGAAGDRQRPTECGKYRGHSHVEARIALTTLTTCPVNCNARLTLITLATLITYATLNARISQ